MPTFCTDSSRRCAVTTISSRPFPAEELSSAAGSAEHGEPADRKNAPVATADASTRIFIPIPSCKQPKRRNKRLISNL